MTKCTLVIGGSGEIGQAILTELLQSGEVVFATYRKHIIEPAERLFTKHVDVRSSESIQELANDIKAKGYLVSKIVYNAGATKDILIHHMQEADFNDIIDANLFGFFRICKAFLADISISQGAIVSISSIAALIGSKGQANYASSKSALIALTRNVACEYAKMGIRANCLILGWIKSTMTENFTLERKEEIRRQIPLRRLGTAKDVADAVNFLLSDKSSYITGQTLIVDGGVTTLKG